MKFLESPAKRREYSKRLHSIQNQLEVLIGSRVRVKPYRMLPIQGKLLTVRDDGKYEIVDEELQIQILPISNIQSVTLDANNL